MNEFILILLTVVVAANVVLMAFLVVPAVLRQRRDRRFADSLQPVGGDGSSRNRIYSPANTLNDDGPAPSRADVLTGLLLPSDWDRILGDEDARVRRYDRPATIVLFELDGLDRLIGALGQGAGDRVTRAVADAMRRHARDTDQLARLGVGRLGVLLPETGEVDAVNYVERVRAACDLWLASGAVALKLAIGWAAPPVGGTLLDAVAIAEERLTIELERGLRPVTETPAPAPQTTSDLSRLAPTA